MSDEYNFDDILPDNGKKNKHKDLLSRLNKIEESSDLINDFSNDSFSHVETNKSVSSNESSFLPSSMLKEKKKKKEYDPDQWFKEMMDIRSTKINKKSSGGRYSYFDDLGIVPKKKNKKKEKNKKTTIDFNKEFEPEIALYRNLLIDQNRFTDDLQREYDSITSTKSSSRGITKQMTDLIENITEARTLSMQLVEKNVNAKKLIAELTMKQKKELGESLNGENMADFASNYLKNMLNERQLLLNGSGDNTVSEYNDEEMFDILSSSLEQSDEVFDRPEETDLYLKYENRNVEIFVIITDDDVENYEFEARDGEGEIIDDYPLPSHTDISVNRSTGIATDTYGKKYKIIWR